MIVNFDVSQIQITDGTTAKIFINVKGTWHYQKVRIKGKDKDLEEITNVVKTTEQEILNELIAVGKKKRIIIKDGIAQYEIEGPVE